jgi:large subunit ribosomal protein L25
MILVARSCFFIFSLEIIMSGLYELTAEIRQKSGRGASRRLRNDNRIPAIIYGAEKEPMGISLNHFHITKALENEGFYSHVLTLDVNGQKQQAVLKDIHRHPFKPKILHMDFLRINPKEKIIMHIPLHFIGEDKAPGIKQGGIFSHSMSSVEIRCLPSDLPEFIEVNVSQLEVDQAIHLSELKLPKGVELMVFAHGDIESHDTGIVKLHIPRVAEETPAQATTVAVPASTSATEKEKAKPEGKK